MAEAHGFLVVRVKAAVLLAISAAADQDTVSVESLTQLAESAGLSQIELRTEYYHEGLETVDDAAMITVFGDEWMDLAQTLVEHGKGIELYGRISHEYGHTSYYIIDSRGERYLETIDYESDHNVDRADEIKAKWRRMIPATIIEAFFSDGSG